MCCPNLQVADMWRSTGRKPDTFLYTNIITGAPCDAAWPCTLAPDYTPGAGKLSLL